MIENIKAEISESIETKQKLLSSTELLSKIQEAVELSLVALRNGGKIIFCGNGGSFADSQHLAAEYISRLHFDRESLASMALGTNSSNLSAIGNDYGYEKVFERELSALGKEGDVFFPISTSGNSPNVIAAIEVAKQKNIKTIAFTGGTGGKIAHLCDCIIVPSSRTEKIQESHIMIGHIICGLVEEEYFKGKV